MNAAIFGSHGPNISGLPPEGHTWFTRIPSRPSSIAALLVRPRSAHLDAAYADTPFRPESESIDPTFTIEPRPERRIGSSTARIPRYGPTVFTSSRRRS